MADGPAYPIESVDRALTLIVMLQESDSIKVSEAGRLLGVSRSTAFRLLSLLEHRQFVIQNPRSKAFHAGPALLRVGLAAVYRSDLRSSILPLIATCWHRTSCTRDSWRKGATRCARS
jgi:DNA-binding IclR family transcriptional regulator